jgi:hypothetical protein
VATSGTGPAVNLQSHRERNCNRTLCPHTYKISNCQDLPMPQLVICFLSLKNEVRREVYLSLCVCAESHTLHSVTKQLMLGCHDSNHILNGATDVLYIRNEHLLSRR